MISPRLLHVRHIDRIVLSVRPDESDIHHSVRIIDFHDKPILIPRYVKNNTIARQNTG